MYPQIALQVGLAWLAEHPAAESLTLCRVLRRRSAGHLLTPTRAARTIRWTYSLVMLPVLLAHPQLS